MGSESEASPTRTGSVLRILCTSTQSFYHWPYTTGQTAVQMSTLLLYRAPGFGNVTLSALELTTPPLPRDWDLQRSVSIFDRPSTDLARHCCPPPSLVRLLGALTVLPFHHVSSCLDCGVTELVHVLLLHQHLYVL